MVFNFFKWLLNRLVAASLWAYAKTIKAAQKRIERNNKVIKALSDEIVELENDNDVMKEYLGQAKSTAVSE